MCVYNPMAFFYKIILLVNIYIRPTNKRWTNSLAYTNIDRPSKMAPWKNAFNNRKIKTVAIKK